ncbi:MAG: tRNA 2-thiocytidine(32) synthetase TtcA [Gammaproteobacteria bacterium]|nr:tRNA 2-thiocytidine(32) synthetase TtcA [Gammaproteobacteria bacterium]
MSSTVSKARKLEIEHNKLRKKLRRLVGRAIADYQMIGQGDRVMVCLSGGKDSYTMLEVLQSLQRNAPIEFSIFAVNVDQKQPGFPPDVLPEYAASQSVEFHAIEEDTYSIVMEKTPEGKTYCPICSRLRRGILYSAAKRFGATKIALGHHLDDVVETLFLNMFHGGRMKAMPPRLRSDDGLHHVIRPLFYVREKDIERYSKAEAHPIIPCDLCGSQSNLQRQVIKSMLREWESVQPGRVENIARAIRTVVPTHLADTELFDFSALEESVDLDPIRQLLIS